MSPEDARHGTRFGYRDDRCKCDRCKKAIALEHNIYKMRRTANGGRPLTVDKLGSVRRLQALMALGWPRRELAAQAGYKGDAFALILNGKRQRLTLATAERIADLYDRLSMTHGPSNPTRIYAAKRGWPPPLAWDAIDDPDELPNLGGIDRDIDPVVVARILGHDASLARGATVAERRAVVAAWPHSLADLERLTGWRAERYVVREDGAA